MVCSWMKERKQRLFLLAENMNRCWRQNVLTAGNLVVSSSLPTEDPESTGRVGLKCESRILI